MLDNLFLPLLLFLPRYYRLQAMAVIALAGWAHDGSSDPTAFGGNDDHQVLQTPAPVHLHSGVRSPSLSLDQPTPDLLLARSSKELQEAWNNFVTHRKAEWFIICSFSFTFLVASPAALQMAHDPVTRFFIYLAIFRAISAIAYSLVQLIYFHDSKTHTAQFAKALAKDIEINKEFVNSAPWVFFALPAVALFWGAITLLLAFISSVWSGGAVNGVSSSIGLALQLTVTMFSVADLCCLFWMIAVLKTVKRSVADADNTPDTTHSAIL